jgi:hypothetical protein
VIPSVLRLRRIIKTNAIVRRPSMVLLALSSSVIHSLGLVLYDVSFVELSRRDLVSLRILVLDMAQDTCSVRNRITIRRVFKSALKIS